MHAKLQSYIKCDYVNTEQPPPALIKTMQFTKKVEQNVTTQPWCKIRLHL